MATTNNIDENTYYTMTTEIADRLKEQLSNSLNDVDTTDIANLRAHIERLTMSANNIGGECWIWYAKTSDVVQDDATLSCTVTGEAELRSGRLQTRARRQDIDGSFDYTLEITIKRLGDAGAIGELKLENLRAEVEYWG